MIKETEGLAISPILVEDERVIVKALEYFTTPEQLEALEDEMLRSGSVDIPVKHTFCDGIYSRQVTMPAGMIAIGHAHSGECLNLVVSGSVSVVLNGKASRISAPFSFVSPPNTRKLGYVHEDLTWITVHATNKVSIDEIESDVLVYSNAFKKFKFEFPDSSIVSANDPNPKRIDDKISYLDALLEIGISHDDVRKITERTEDLIQFPGESGSFVFVGTSEISGNGLFSNFKFNSGEVIVPARIKGKRTPAGRYVNHAKRPNCRFVVDINGDINLVADLDINIGQELTVDYKDAFYTARIADQITQKITK